MRDSRVVICGLARDVVETLPETSARIEALGQQFADYRVVIYENDSSDATPELLADWAEKNDRVKVLVENRGDPVNMPIRCLQRAARMAHYRNQYREYVRDHYADYDYAVIVDMDLPNGWYEPGVANTFGHDDWDFVGSYGILRKLYWRQEISLHFDAWAFRPKGSFAPLTTKQANRLMWNFGDPMVAVSSCFGGLGIYRMPALVEFAYAGWDCEHVTLHQRMIRSGMDRLFLNPSQLTFYGTRIARLRHFYQRAMTHLSQRRAA